MLNNLPDDVPKNIESLLKELTGSTTHLLRDSLVGVYLHGSLAMGCFNPELSDIDVIVVTAEKLNIEQRRAMADLMIRLSEQAPAKGLEVSVVTINVTQHLEHPTPFEFHFSSEWLEDFKSGKVDLSKDRRDGDLAGHFTIILHRGVVLFGKPIREVFADVATEYYRDSIVADAKDILEDMSSNPVYSVLNLCRVWAFIEDGLITSKREGGEWALHHVARNHEALIRQALAEYGGSGKAEWNNSALEAFGESIRSIIN